MILKCVKVQYERSRWEGMVMEELFLGMLPGLIAAVISAYLAAKWSIRKFYAERWWQRKELAYHELIEALYDVIQYLEVMKENYGQGTGLSETRESEIRSKYSSAYWKVKKATDIGDFIVSTKAAVVLKKLRDRPKLDWNDGPDWEIYEQDYIYYLEALNQVVIAAKEDLNVK